MRDKELSSRKVEFSRTSDSVCETLQTRIGKQYTYMLGPYVSRTIYLDVSIRLPKFLGTGYLRLPA